MRSSSFRVSGSSSIEFIMVSFPPAYRGSLYTYSRKPAVWVKTTSRKLRIPCPGGDGGTYPPTYPGAYSPAYCGVYPETYSRAYSGVYSLTYSLAYARVYSGV